MDAGSPRLARKASTIPPFLTPVLKSLGLEEEDPEDVFEIHSKEGAGAFGRVFRASYRRDPSRQAALKVIPVALEAGQRGEDIENVRREIQFLRECDHPNVVAFFGAYYKDSALWVAMEYCGGGSVGDVSRRRRLEEDEIAVIMRGALQGLAYLHARKKIHRDIKGGNILLTSDGQVKIADFGVSAQLKDTMSRRGTFVGTPYWMSPEMIQESDYDYKSDIWSLGITMIELADQKPPLFDEHPMRVLIQIPRNPPPSVKAPHLWAPLFIEFLQFCLRKDPTERPSAVECLDHAFIQRVANVAFVYAIPVDARRALAASSSPETTATAPAETETEDPRDTVEEETKSTVESKASTEKSDSEAMSDDVTLKASAFVRPAKPLSTAQPQVAVKPHATGIPGSSSGGQVSSSLHVAPVAAVVLKPETDKEDDHDHELVESGVGTPRHSESVVEDVWDHALTSSRSSRSDDDDNDDESTAAAGNDASAEGFAFRRKVSQPTDVSVPVPEEPAAALVHVASHREVSGDDLLQLSMDDDDSFEMPAMALISKIQAAGQSVRTSSFSPAVAATAMTATQPPVPLQPAKSPNLRASKTKQSSVTEVTAVQQPVQRRDLSSFSRSFESFSRVSQPPLMTGSPQPKARSDVSKNPLAELTTPSHDRVNALLSSISASTTRLTPQPQHALETSSLSLRGSAMGGLPSAAYASQSISISSSNNNNFFIGAPFRVSHQLCVQYNTVDAKFEGAPTTSEWATIHRQFGIPLAQMHCRSNATDHVPALLHMLRRELVKRDGLDCKYIYRVSPEQSAVVHAMHAINGGVFDAASVSDPHVFASLIKHWLRELPSALLAKLSRQDVAAAVQNLTVSPGKNSDLHAIATQPAIEFARPFSDVHAYVTTTLLDKLPASERGVVLWLVDHMLEVIAKSARNGMTAQSLAVVMAPNVYRWASATPSDASLIASQVAMLLRVLLAWRQRCCQGATSGMDDTGTRTTVGHHSVRSRAFASAVASSSSTSAIAWNAATGSSTSVRDSLHGLSLRASGVPRDSTVSNLLRRSSVASNFVSVSSNPASSELPGQQGSVMGDRSSPSPEVSLEHALRDCVDRLWDELPLSLLLHDKPPIVRSLHTKFHNQILTLISRYGKRDQERRWAAAQLLSQASSRESDDTELLRLPIGIRKWRRWIHAALHIEGFVALLHHERQIRERLEKDHDHHHQRGTLRLSPEQVFSIHHRLALGMSTPLTNQELHGGGDHDSTATPTTKAMQLQHNAALLDGAATFVRLCHKSQTSSAAKSQHPLLAEDVVRLGEEEPVLGQLLMEMSGYQMRRYHMKDEHDHVIAMVERAMMLV